ncbi:MAG: lysylphosphatidylglycerol synthase domain-containing protein [Steroidobacteraceae bacterium]
MRLAARIALAAGLAVMIVLIVREGGRSIVTLLSGAGGILLLLVPLHALPIGLDVLGWRTLIGRLAPPPGFGVLFWIAAVREACNRLLPVANIGGEIVGIRLLAARGGVEGPAAAASVVIEVLLTLVSQLLFVLLGVALLLRATRGPGPEPLRGIELGVGVAVVVIACLFLLLRYGSIFERLERLAQRMIGLSRGTLPEGWLPVPAPRRTSPGTPASSPWRELDASVRELYRARTGLAATVGWQLAGLLSGSLEVWLALRWLGAPIDLEAAIALESLTQALRQFIFLVPAGLGVQELGLVGFGSLLGVAPDVAITLSLVKRMREILFGVPALASWQWAAGWRGLPPRTYPK